MRSKKFTTRTRYHKNSSPADPSNNPDGFSMVRQHWKLCSAPTAPSPELPLQKQVSITLAVDPLLICHIIDDITLKVIDWPPNMLKLWNKILRKLFQAAILPISERKSCPAHQIVTDKVPFIDLLIDLKSSIVSPQVDKYNSVAAQPKNLSASSAITIRK